MDECIKLFSYNFSKNHIFLDNCNPELINYIYDKLNSHKLNSYKLNNSNNSNSRKFTSDKSTNTDYTKCSLFSTNLHTLISCDVIITQLNNASESHLSHLINILNPTGLLILVNPKQSLKLSKFCYNKIFSDNFATFHVYVKSLDLKSVNYGRHVISKITPTLVIYVFSSVNSNVLFFIRHGIFKSSYVKFILVCNGDDKIDVPDFVHYVTRPNIGYDFGGWSEIIHMKVNDKLLIDDYQYFILLNSTVRGPFVPPYIKYCDWTQLFTKWINSETKLVGTTLGVFEHMSHIQSMCMVTDRTGLNIGIQENIFEENPIQRSKQEIIMQKEIGFSQAILKRGYKIKPLVNSYFNSEINPQIRAHTLIHISNGGNFGGNIHPYEVIFIKDNQNINFNKDINICTDNVNTGYDRLHIISKLLDTKRSEFQWKHYLLKVNGSTSLITPHNTVRNNKSIKLVFDHHQCNFDRLSTLPVDFDWKEYIRLNPDVGKIHSCENGAIIHWINYGYSEQRPYKCANKPVIISAPPSFEPDVYRNSNSDIPQLKHMDDSQLLDHYNKYGKQQGLLASRIKYRSDITKYLPMMSDKLYLEIGPCSKKKAILNHDLPNVHSIDVVTKEEMVKIHSHEDKDDIIQPTYIWKGQQYSELINHRYDYVYSSHNIEHVPDLVGYINNIDSVLKPDGLVILYIPDYRYCFDHFKHESTIFQVLNNYYYKYTQPKLEHIFESTFHLVSNNPIDHWTNKSGVNPVTCFDDTTITNMRNLLDNFNDNVYIDAHVWKFTPQSFENIMSILYRMRLIRLVIQRIYYTCKYDHEFRVILSKAF